MTEDDELLVMAQTIRSLMRTMTECYPSKSFAGEKKVMREVVRSIKRRRARNNED